MRRFSRLGPTLILVVLGVLLSGCDLNDSPRDTSSPVSTDRTVYTAQPMFADCTAPGCAYEFTVIASYKNHMDRPLYLARCDPDSPTPIYGVRLVEPEGESAYGPIWACGGHDNAILVQPGETRTDTLLISGPNVFDGETGEPLGLLEGQFVLVYQVQICPEQDSRCLLVDAAGRSSVFEVWLAR